MNRREALRNASLVVGGMISAPVWAGAMGKTLNTGSSIVVSSAQEALLAELADVIIPTTNTPGAKAAGADKFIIRVVRDCFAKADQENFYGSLAKFDQECGGFAQLSGNDKITAVKKLPATDTAFFMKMKELTVTGYFTSKIGATEALAYVAVPGKFQACIPLEKNQKTWALN